VLVVVGGPGVVPGGPAGVVLVDPQPEVQLWKSEAQVAAPDCAAEAQSPRQPVRSDDVRHPVTHVWIPAATVRAHAPRSPPQPPRHAGVDPSPTNAPADDSMLHAATQLRASELHVARAPRAVVVQPRIHAPRSAGAAVRRQSIRQLAAVIRAVFRQTTSCAAQPAGHG
jgi:hypothetical protein